MTSFSPANIEAASAETASGQTDSRSARADLLRVIVGWILLSAITLSVSLAAYALLDLSLGTIFAAAIVATIVATGSGTLVRGVKTLAVGAVLIGLMATTPVLLAGLTRPHFLGMWFQLLGLCIALAGAFLSIAQLLKRGVGDSVATAASLTAGLLWLTWPVWLSPAFHTPAGTWMVDQVLPYQPLIALNGVFPTMGDWSHAPIAYKWLTNLGQDSPFALPRHAGLSMLAHLLLAVVLGAIAGLLQWRDRRKSTTPSATLSGLVS